MQVNIPYMDPMVAFIFWDPDPGTCHEIATMDDDGSPGKDEVAEKRRSLENNFFFQMGKSQILPHYWPMPIQPLENLEKPIYVVYVDSDFWPGP